MTQEEKDDEIIAELENFYNAQNCTSGEFEARIKNSHEKIQAIKYRSLSEENNKRAEAQKRKE